MDKRGELQSTLRIEDVPTVRSMVAQKLREAIMAGTLKPGQRLVSREGDLWRWDGFVSRAEAPRPAAVRLEQYSCNEAATTEIQES